MASDKKEKGRKLTPAEQKRLAHFEEISREYEQQGYKKTDLTVSIVKANVFALILGVPVLVLGFLLFLQINHDLIRVRFGLPGTIGFVAALIVLTVIHELVHGATWGLLSGNHFRDIEFGFIKESLTPYCTCTRPLSKGKYILGALMPLIVCGIIPSVVALAADFFVLYLLGLIMIIGASGDIMIVFMILTHRTRAKDVLFMDHPTQAGGVVFEKDRPTA